MNTIPTPFGECYAMTVPSLSTSHITERDGQLLNGPVFRPFASLQDGSGHILHISDGHATEFQDFSPWFRNIVKGLHEAGFSYVRFDCDGDILPGLSTFDW